MDALCETLMHDRALADLRTGQPRRFTGGWQASCPRSSPSASCLLNSATAGDPLPLDAVPALGMPPAHRNSQYKKKGHL